MQFGYYFNQDKIYILMIQTVKETNFKFEGQKSFYRGKVRDVYEVYDKLIMVATDRISAFDYVLPQTIPYKGQVLNQLSAFFLHATADIVPNWLESVPDPNVSAGKKCEPIRLEMIVRAYLVGHAWRLYKSGKRSICGVPLPEGMKQYQKFPHPIITPSYKSLEGHDEDISKEEILAKGIVSPDDYAILEEYSYKLFEKGSAMAEARGLILVDTKYEFGYYGDDILLIDEVHTPDSSRYFYLDGFEEKLKKGEPPKQLSKEFVREWLKENGFEGKEGQKIPQLPPDVIAGVSERYIELYEMMTGQRFARAISQEDILDRIRYNIERYLETIKHKENT